MEPEVVNDFNDPRCADAPISNDRADPPPRSIDVNSLYKQYPQSFDALGREEAILVAWLADEKATPLDLLKFLSDPDIHLKAQIPGLDAESGRSNDPSPGEAKLREKLGLHRDGFVLLHTYAVHNDWPDPSETIVKNMPARKRDGAIDPFFSSCCTTLAVRVGDLWSFLSSHPEELLTMSQRQQANASLHLECLTRWILCVFQNVCEIPYPERLATGLREFQRMLETVNDAQIPLKFRAEGSGRLDFIKLLLQSDTEHTLFPRFLEIIREAGVDSDEDCHPDRGMPITYLTVVTCMCCLPGKLADEKVQQVVTALQETSLNHKKRYFFDYGVDLLQNRWGGLNTSQLKRDFAEALARLQ
jgi:hypothetical protein